MRQAAPFIVTTCVDRATFVVVVPPTLTFDVRRDGQPVTSRVASLLQQCRHCQNVASAFAPRHDSLCCRCRRYWMKKTRRTMKNRCWMSWSGDASSSPVVLCSHLQREERSATLFGRQTQPMTSTCWRKPPSLYQSHFHFHCCCCRCRKTTMMMTSNLCVLSLSLSRLVTS